MNGIYKKKTHFFLGAIQIIRDTPWGWGGGLPKCRQMTYWRDGGRVKVDKRF